MNALILLSIASFVLSCIAFCLTLFFAGTLTHGNNQPAEEPEVTR